MQIAIDIYTFTRKEEHCPSLTNSQMPHGNFDQQPDATRKDYDVAIPALRERSMISVSHSCHHVMTVQRA